MQHLLRGVALGTALIGGGVLFHVWEPFPFLVAAIVVTAACTAPVVFLREDGGHGRVFEGVRVYLRHSWRVLRREPEVRRFLIANTAWEGTRLPASGRSSCSTSRSGSASRSARRRPC